jgi:chorismate mutase
MKAFCEDNFYHPDELVGFLNLSIEDIIAAFPSKLVSKYKEIYGNASEEEA